MERLQGTDLYCGDCISQMATMPAASFDACLTDPPYHLASIVKRFGADGAAAPVSDGATGVYKRSAAGFMGKRWDGGDISFQPETWAAVLRVLKPGAHLVAFAAPKNAHRLTCAIEDAGFEIRDVVMWLFGTGFPKSHNVSKAIMRQLGEDCPNIEDGTGWEGYGTALKPAYEPIIIARKPLIGTVADNCLEHGTGAFNIDACRVATDLAVDDPRLGGNGQWNIRRHPDGHTVSLPPATIGSSKLGRWPANIAHDGSDEVLALFPDSVTKRCETPSQCDEAANTWGGTFQRNRGARGHTDAGSAARFFYCAKANAADRAGSKHPTVKPIALMQWLVRLVAAEGSRIIDPFAGTGATAEAACREGVHSTMIEADEQSQEDIRRRMNLAYAGPDERDNAMRVIRGEVERFDETELGSIAA